nr:hypothetical protein [Beijerinckia sp. L45]
MEFGLGPFDDFPDVKEIGRVAGCAGRGEGQEDVRRLVCQEAERFFKARSSEPRGPGASFIDFNGDDGAVYPEGVALDLRELRRQAGLLIVRRVPQVGHDVAAAGVASRWLAGVLVEISLGQQGRGIPEIFAQICRAFHVEKPRRRGVRWRRAQCTPDRVILRRNLGDGRLSFHQVFEVVRHPICHFRSSSRSLLRFRSVLAPTWRSGDERRRQPDASRRTVGR